MKPKTLAYLELLCLALGLALFFWWIGPKAPIPVQTTPTIIVSTKGKPIFHAPIFEAKAVYIYDAAADKVVFEHNSSLQLPLASLTKLMTAVTAKNLLPDYVLVRISRENLLEEGDTGLLIGEEWTLGNLLDFSLVASSNDGIQAIAEATGGPSFVAQMNALAQEMGLHESYFLNPSGLDVSTSLSGGYGSARDVAMLVAHILGSDPHLLEATSFNTLTISSKTAMHKIVNTDKALDAIPNVLASKTGFTDLSGGNLVVAFDAGLGHTMIITILGSSYDGRFEDMKKLVDETVRYLGDL